MWLKVIGAGLALVGLILVLDARRIIQKNYPTVEENRTVLGAKILGTIVAIIGGFLCVL